MRASNLDSKYPNDINQAEFVSEIECFKFQADALLNTLATATPLDLLNMINKYSFEEAYANIDISLILILPLSVTAVSCELSFSKLYLIKNYLRSSMGQDHLSNMAMISIEQSVANSLSYDIFIDSFVTLKARKIPL